MESSPSREEPLDAVMLSLYPFQQKASLWLCTRSRAVLGSDLGTGKTPTIISTASRFPGANNVICPAHLVLMWAKMVEIWGTPGQTWRIFSYENFVKRIDEDSVPPASKYIIDEAHNVKTIGTQRTRAILGANSPLRDAGHVWMLTGTPFPNNICDCYTLFNFCLYGKLGDYWDFASQYAFIEKNRYGQRAVGCKDHMIPTLVEKVSSVLHRDFTEDVLPELPTFTESIVPLSITYPPRGQQTVYLAPIMDTDIEARILSDIATGRDLKPKDQENVSAFLRRFGELKVDGAVNFISDLLSQNQQVVVFCKHVDVVEQITTRLQATYADAVSMIYGGTLQIARDSIVEKFQTGEKRCVIFTIATGSEGITLTAGHIAVFVEWDWTPKALLQAMKRIHRIGQLHPCHYYHLVIPNSFDERLRQVVLEKAKAVEGFWTEFKKQREETAKVCL